MPPRASRSPEKLAASEPAAAAGLTQGAKCSVLDGELVAAATADSVAFGKITEPTVDGFASAMLIQQ